MAEITVGQSAPDFQLQDEQGNAVRLLSYRHRKNVLLIFYPGDDTPGCIKQLCAVRDDYAKFRQTGTVVLGVNHANSESHQKFIDKYRLKTPLLIDPEKKVSRAYGAVKKFFGHDVIKRSVVLVDKAGIIRYLKRGLSPDSEILEAIRELP